MLLYVVFKDGNNKYHFLKYIHTLIINFISLFQIQFVAEEGSNYP